MTYTPKGVTYNRETIRIINKLVDKNCLPIAYKLLKSLKPSSYFDEKTDSGQFFIKKLITSQNVITVNPKNICHVNTNFFFLYSKLKI